MAAEAIPLVDLFVVWASSPLRRRAPDDGRVVGCSWLLSRCSLSGHVVPRIRRLDQAHR